MISQPIRVEYVHPPIPVRDFDYSATFASYEPGDPCGCGPTAYAAIVDLLMSVDDPEPAGAPRPAMAE